MKHMFIVLEGLSGCGKTTVGKILAEKLRAVFYKTPASLFCPIRSVVDEKADLIARFLFYLAGLAQSSVEIRQLCETQHVVCDRYLDTTVCYHKAMGVPVDLLINSLEPVFMMPTATFLLVCKQEERIGRLHRRGLTYNDIIERRSGVEENFLAEYKKKQLIEIDNSSNDPNTATNEILNYLASEKI